MDALPLSVQRIVTGAGLALLGGILTGGGYLWAALHQSGGTYLIFTGLFFWGGIRAFQGFMELPGFLAARRSGDPWTLARQYPARIGPMISQGVVHDNPVVRSQALAQIPYVVKRFPVVQLAPMVLAGLVDPVEGVRDSAYHALLFIAQSDRRAGIGMITAVLNLFHQREDLIAFVPGGRNTLNQFLDVSQDSSKYIQWIKSGVLPGRSTP